MNIRKLISLAILPVVLAACGGGESINDYNHPMLAEESLGGSYTSVSNNAPYLMAPGARYYLGSPYQLEGVQYVPAEDLFYNQTGIAGIIPNEMNGVQTINGETFNADQLLGTSKTLPLPSIVRVTNLDNGRSAVLRVNNRGPFVNSRIMDVSPAAARQLGMGGQTKVQIQILAEQSTQVKNATLGNVDVSAVEMAPPPPPATAPESSGGPYAVQLGAFHSEDSAQSVVQKVAYIGRATVVYEDDLYKVRITGLDASAARNTIDTLRRNEAMSPGLLMNGRWVNADSI
ncbi:MAG: septal ring lytic transglycosylase RlpA family protein [Alphaproteobacteria bacterium]|nr:septal ring lytic transglycosylase RlpA family protein [Alphaproteobacteria bacterium]